MSNSDPDEVLHGVAPDVGALLTWDHADTFEAAVRRRLGLAESFDLEGP